MNHTKEMGKREERQKRLMKFKGGRRSFKRETGQQGHASESSRRTDRWAWRLGGHSDLGDSSFVRGRSLPRDGNKEVEEAARTLVRILAMKRRRKVCSLEKDAVLKKNLYLLCWEKLAHKYSL